jgi:hypothetical protein
MSRRGWKMPVGTLGNKAFSFGIFWARIGPVKMLSLRCFTTEICQIPIVWNPGAETGLSLMVLSHGPSLGKVISGGATSRKGVSVL